MVLVDKDDAGNKRLIAGLIYAVGSVCSENHLYEC